MGLRSEQLPSQALGVRQTWEGVSALTYKLWDLGNFLEPVSLSIKWENDY